MRSLIAAVLFACLIIPIMLMADADLAAIELRESPLSKNKQDVPQESTIPDFVSPADRLETRGANISRVDLPSRWDWREQGVVTPMGDNGPCGAAGAFTLIECLQARMVIEGKPLYDFSENNAKECNWKGTGCSVVPHNVAHFFTVNGAVMDDCDPYEPTDGSCKSTCPQVSTVRDWRIISGASVPSVDLLKSYIHDYGPISSYFYSGSGDAWRAEIVAYDGSYTLHYTGTETPSHPILIVGWDDDLAHAGGTGGWIVKNHWGDDWGGPCGYGDERGYFTIAYGSANIGYWSIYVHDWEPYDHYGGLLYWDEARGPHYWGFTASTDPLQIWAMCKYVTPSSMTVTGVEFWTNDTVTNAGVYIYNGFDGNSLTSLLGSSLNHSFREGYHSVDLDVPFTIGAAEDIFAVVHLTNSSYAYPGTTDDEGIPQPGYTFLSPTGTNNWIDMGTDYNQDVIVRVRYQTATCVDSDGDGAGDPDHPENECPVDNCPDYWNYDQVNSDADTFGDACDNCPDITNDDQADSDGDFVGDVCDACPGYDDSLDDDQDGIPDDCDICQGYDDNVDTDADGVPNGCDLCEGFDDGIDTDTDGVPDGCDLCEGYDDNIDTDEDGVPDACDICEGFNDAADIDEDGVPLGCDICQGYDDNVDTDTDGVPDGCDLCEGYDDGLDDDQDGIPDDCDLCPGFDDGIDPDEDGIPTGCDICEGFDDNIDTDEDDVPDGCDQCEGFDDSIDSDEDGIPDGCDYICGDVNEDATINVGDAVFLINYIFKDGNSPDPWCAGDTNTDDAVNVGDAVFLINYVFKNGNPPGEQCCP